MVEVKKLLALQGTEYSAVLTPYHDNGLFANVLQARGHHEMRANQCNKVFRSISDMVAGLRRAVACKTRQVVSML